MFTTACHLSLHRAVLIMSKLSPPIYLRSISEVNPDPEVRCSRMVQTGFFYPPFPSKQLRFNQQPLSEVTTVTTTIIIVIIKMKM